MIRTTNIGELAKKTSLSPSKIRFFEKIGLLKTSIGRRRKGGYRHELAMVLHHTL
ncbi:MerR family DNA-binding transcriptional regulator [Vibrio sp. FJH11]